MKSFLFLLYILTSFTTKAYVHVGNGGGAAEMLMLQLVPGLPKWAATCNKNPGLCGKQIHFNESDLQKLRSTTINFIEDDYKEPLCQSKIVHIARKSLYINNDIPKSLPELSGLLIRSILSCNGWSAKQLAPLVFDLDPRAKNMTRFGVYILNGSQSDIINGPGLVSVQDLLTRSTSCLKYRILSSVNDYLNLYCIDNNQNYLVQVTTNSNGAVQFISRFDGGSDSE